MTAPEHQSVANIFTPRPGTPVLCRGQHGIILKQLNLLTFLIDIQNTEERIAVSLQEITPWTETSGPKDTHKIPDLAAIPDKKRDLGLKRQAILLGLQKMHYRTRQDVSNAGEEMGLSVSQVYALMAKLERYGTWTCLIPHASKGKPRKKRLSDLAESIIQEAIDKVFLNHHNAPAAEVVREATTLCKRAGILVPAPNSIKSRIQARPPRTVVAARRGEKNARDLFDPVLGPIDEARWPLQQVQIDHTVADVFVVSEETGQTVGRPVLTLVIDEFSRMVLGFHLSLRPPSTVSVALALTHAVLPKDDFFKQHGIQSRWDAFGIPAQLLTDSGAEFDSRGLIAGCAQYGINAVFRPLARPHFGGRVERLLGSLCGRVRLMPGASMRSIAERAEGYDPEKEAALTIQEAETRIALEIDIYHHSVHQATGTTPIKLWEFGILGDEKTPGRGAPTLPSDPRRFLLDFFPMEKRSVQDYGIQLEYLRYHAPILRNFVTGKSKSPLHIVRYDPRDMSRVFLFDPQAVEYHEIPRANANFPPVALWEVKSAIKHLKATGVDPEDEMAIQRAIEQARQIDEAAIVKSKKARKNIERRKEDARGRVKFSRLSKNSDPIETGMTEAPPTGRRKAKPITDVEAW